MTGTTAKVVADSISRHNRRVTTMEVTMHRFVLAEFNTHRVFSRNSASSRAIPVEKQLDRLLNDAAWPLSFPAEQPGMQGGAELTGKDLTDADELWDDVRRSTFELVANYVAAHPKERRLHKSVTNRLLEPFMWHTVIVTSTDWTNFFALRCHELAQPEIRAAAELMKKAYDSSTPNELPDGLWHLPYTQDFGTDTLEEAMKKSVARCAWVSTMGHDKDHSYEAVERMYDRLAGADPMHASPFEHQCTPTGWEAPGDQIGNLRGWRQLRHMIERGVEPWNR